MLTCQILHLYKKLPKNVGDLGKLIVATGFEKMPKVQKIASVVTLRATYIVTLRAKVSYDEVNIIFCEN